MSKYEFLTIALELFNYGDCLQCRSLPFWFYWTVYTL